MEKHNKGDLTQIGWETAELCSVLYSPRGYFKTHAAVAESLKQSKEEGGYH